MMISQSVLFALAVPALAGPCMRGFVAGTRAGFHASQARAAREQSAGQRGALMFVSG